MQVEKSKQVMQLGEQDSHVGVELLLLNLRYVPLWQKLQVVELIQLVHPCGQFRQLKVEILKY